MQRGRRSGSEPDHHGRTPGPLALAAVLAALAGLPLEAAGAAPDGPPSPSLAEILAALRPHPAQPLIEAEKQQLWPNPRFPEDESPDGVWLYRFAEQFRGEMLQHLARARALRGALAGATSPRERSWLTATLARHLNEARERQVEALKMYLRIVTAGNGPAFPLMDKVLYHLVDLLLAAGRAEKARIFFGLLIRRSPHSQYLPDAYVAFGNSYHAAHRPKDALPLYRVASADRTHPVHGFVVLMQAICWRQLGHPHKAAAMLRRIIRESSTWAGTPEGKRLLVEKAREVLEGSPPRRRPSRRPHRRPTARRR